MKTLIAFFTKIFPRQWLIKLSYLFSWMIRPFYWGNKVECPVCGGHFRKFLPYGYGNAMDNRLCPKCLSLERHRLLWLYLKEKTDFFTASLKVLHFAPEQPFLKRFRALKNLDYTTADLDSPIADLHLDVTAIDQPSDTYDVVICNHVLEHVSDANKAFSEIKRILNQAAGQFSWFQSILMSTPSKIQASPTRRNVSASLDNTTTCASLAATMPRCCVRQVSR